jgi:hypothetical protein
MRSPAKIFLSYVRKDKERVEQLYDKLSKAGYKPWMDTHDVLGGQLWRSSIEQAIKSADFFLACLSRRSVSKRGYLQKELRDALSIWNEKLPEDIFLIPVRLEDCKVPASLSQFQWIDLFAESGWEQLAKALQTGAHHGKPSWGRSARRGTPNATPGSVKAPPAPSKRSTSATSPEGKSCKQQPKRAQLPTVTFPNEMYKLIDRYSPKMWSRLDEAERRFVVTLGTKLEPIVQVARPTPVPMVLGFESLALGPLGENFDEICDRLRGFDPGIIRLLLMLAAMKTASLLRVSATEAGNIGARHLLFTLNIDPETLDCKHLDDFLARYHLLWENNVLFEVNEQTSLQCLQRLKDLQADFNLRYCADDFNNWRPEVRIAFRDRVEMTKIDFRGFQEAMAIRGDAPQESIERIASSLIPGKPLVVEGVQDDNHLRFLEGRWSLEKYGELFGQGYSIEPGLPWQAWTDDLREFGLPGGHILAAANHSVGGNHMPSLRESPAWTAEPKPFPARKTSGEISSLFKPTHPVSGATTYVTARGEWPSAPGIVARHCAHKSRIAPGRAFSHADMRSLRFAKASPGMLHSRALDRLRRG